MGVTSFDLGLLKGLIQSRNIRSVIELGSQNNYSQGGLPAPFMREWYNEQGISYFSIDLNGECGAMKLDLSRPVEEHKDALYYTSLADMVTDFGTSEHVSTGNIFNWEAIYNCWILKFKLLKIGGILFSENPKTGNWPGHGAFYYTEEFYTELQEKSGLKIISLGTHPAMGNITDGWNVYCIMEKTNEEFPTLEEFKTLDLRKN